MIQHTLWESQVDRDESSIPHPQLTRHVRGHTSADVTTGAPVNIIIDGRILKMLHVDRRGTADT